MAIMMAFGRLVCRCDVCAYVWMPDKGAMPKRCANTQKACRRWNALGGDLNNKPIPRVLPGESEAPEPIAAEPELVKSALPCDPDGVRRKCRSHKLFYDLCRSKACQQEHQCILDRMQI